MKNLLTVAILLASLSSFAQKFYVWCPNEMNIKPRNGFLEKDTIDVIIYDGRSLGNKVKEKCETNEIDSQIVLNLVKAYPDAIIQKQSNNLYFKDPNPNHITLKIGIAGYHAAFGSDLTAGIGSIGGSFSYGVVPRSTWNAVTAFYLSLYNGSKDKVTKEVSKIDSRPNSLGHATAKLCLNKAYQDAVQQLLFFVDQTLMK